MGAKNLHAFALLNHAGLYRKADKFHIALRDFEMTMLLMSAMLPFALCAC